MNNANSEFARRCQEIEEHISYIEMLEKQTGFSVTLLSTMKASSLLMLYNLVESTMTNIVQEIFDHLQSKNVAFSGLGERTQIVVLQNAKRRNSANLVAKMRAAPADLCVASFERDDVFSGNLDSRKVRDTLKEFGVKTTSTYAEQVLLTIKTTRNDLAHGTTSFVDCGRNYSATDLRTYFSKTKILLTKALADFSAHLNSQAYL